MPRSSLVQVCAWLLDTMLPCFALFAGVPRRQMNLGLGRENFSVIVPHVLMNTDMVHDNYFYAGRPIVSSLLEQEAQPFFFTSGHPLTLTPVDSTPQATSWASTRRRTARATSRRRTSTR